MRARATAIRHPGGARAIVLPEMERPHYREFGAGALAPFAECFWSGGISGEAPYPVPPDHLVCFATKV